MSRWWRDDAACNLSNSTLFDPPSNEPDLAGRIAKAARICARCPVRAECVETAAANHESGVRAGVMLIDGHPAPKRGRPPAGDVDDVAVEMAMQGLRVDLNQAERSLAIGALTAAGLSPTQISDRLHMNFGAVKRWLLRNKQEAAA